MNILTDDLLQDRVADEVLLERRMIGCQPLHSNQLHLHRDLTGAGVSIHAMRELMLLETITLFMKTKT